MDFLSTALGLDSACIDWIERVHRLRRYARRKAARPIIVTLAFSSYRHVESVISRADM